MELVKTEKSAGIVIEDLGLEKASFLQIRAQVVVEIFKVMKRDKMTQKVTAELLEIKQPDISKMKNGDFSHYGLESLIGFLNKLGKAVEIKIRPLKKGKPAKWVTVN